MVSPQPPSPSPSPRLMVVRAHRGWEVREESENGLVRVSRHTDWHRVERSVRRFEIQTSERRRSNEPVK